MRTLKHSTLAISALFMSSGIASPVEIDGDAFHLIVSRPVDSWSGDTSLMEDELAVIAKKRARFEFLVPPPGRGRKGAGLDVWNHASQDDATVADTVSLIESRGFEISYWGGFHWTLGLPVPLQPSDYGRYRALQSASYSALILRQGDPDSVASSIRMRRYAGNMLSIAAVGLAGAKFGGTGAYVVTEAFADDISRLPLVVRQTMAPFDLPTLDASSFAAIEVYPVRVLEGGSSGQLIVAYREEPTAATRHDALVHGLASLAGSDTTMEAVEASRAADFRHRRDVWNACASDPSCAERNAAPAAPGESK